MLALRIAAGPAAARLAESVVEVCEGQFDDLAFEQRDTLSLDECLAMAGQKTGALLGAAWPDHPAQPLTPVPGTQAPSTPGPGGGRRRAPPTSDGYPWGTP